jgi:hypothetical protein
MKNYKKIIKLDPKIKKYTEWVNMCCKNIDENNKLKKTHSIKNLYSLDSIKIENNENIIEKFENTSDCSSDIYNNINIYNFICSNNSFYYIYGLNNQYYIQDNILDNNILLFTKKIETNLENNIITKYILYPIILFCRYIY